MSPYGAKFGQISLQLIMENLDFLSSVFLSYDANPLPVHCLAGPLPITLVGLGGQGELTPLRSSRCLLCPK